MSKIIKIGLIATLLIYIGGLTFTYYSNKQFNEKLEIFDLNKNGLIDKNETNKESLETAIQQATRKTTKQGAVVLIPVSLIIGLFIFGMAYLFKKIKTIDDNEIDYRKRN